MSKILFERIYSYNYPEIKKFIERVFNELDVYSEIEKKNFVMVKPNLLTVSDRTSNITTHPMIAEAVIESILESTSKRIIISDGSAGMYTDMTDIFEKSGFKSLADKYDLELYNINSAPYIVRNGIKLVDILDENPYLINIAKLKTHMLTKLTLSVKNLYGLIPGRIKLFYHSQYPDYSSFSAFIARVYQAVLPDLNIIDGIIGMEHNGPSNGDDVNTAMAAASKDGFALDHFIADFAGYSLNEIAFLKYALDKKYYSGEYTCGKMPDKHPLVRTDANKFNISLKLAKNKFVKYLSNSYPVIDNSKCRKCLKCVKICGNEAISIKNGFPFVRRRKCITCYCCTEVCPFDSIDVPKSLLERITNAK